jgi:hypothetical protein
MGSPFMTRFILLVAFLAVLALATGLSFALGSDGRVVASGAGSPTSTTRAERSGAPAGARAGSRTASGVGVTMALAADRSTPPLPVITKHPGNSTTARSARFEFADRGNGVIFVCALDRDMPHVCRSPKTFHNLRFGRHMFCVRAVNPAGRASRFRCLAVLIIRVRQHFAISGSPLPGVLLYPGGGSVPVNLVFANPNAWPITVTLARVGIRGTSATGCAVSNFSVTRQWRGGVVVPPKSSRTLQGKGVLQSRWPQLRMRDRGDQDACQHATVRLSFTGWAQ